MYYRNVTAEDFYYTIVLARVKSKAIAETCTLYTERYYQFTKCYLSEDGASGFAINRYNELISVFSIVRGRGLELSKTAVKLGANNLRCFDNALNVFSEAGFRVVETVTSREGTRAYYMRIPGTNIEDRGGL